MYTPPEILFNPQFHQWVVIGIFLAVPAMWAAEKFIKAPMGKYARDTGYWGPLINYRMGWVFMETPAVILFVWLFVQGRNSGEFVPQLLLGLWLLHYFDRTFIYPIRIRGNSKLSLSVSLSGAFYQSANAYINAFWITQFSNQYTREWLTDPRFIAGTAIFLFGFVINRHSEHLLRNLRKPGETGYKIPYGGMYKFVSCPHYFGEIILWTGWAILTWSWAGASFAVFTTTNIGTRAFTAHQWYKENFEDYPSERKALVPYLF